MVLKVKFLDSFSYWFLVSIFNIPCLISVFLFLFDFQRYFECCISSEGRSTLFFYILYGALLPFNLIFIIHSAKKNRIDESLFKTAVKNLQLRLWGPDWSLLGGRIRFLLTAAVLFLLATFQLLNALNSDFIPYFNLTATISFLLLGWVASQMILICGYVAIFYFLNWSKILFEFKKYHE